MSDEWRLTAELDGDAQVVERVVVDIRGRLTGGGRLTRDGQTVRVYSESEPEAARAEALVLQLLERSPLGYELWHDRWDGEAGDWEEIAPDLPPGEEPPKLEELRELEEPATAEETPETVGAGAELTDFPGAATTLTGAGLLVLVTFADREAASALRSQLTEAGIQSVARRRGVGIPAADDTAAAALTAHLRSHLPAGTRIDTTRIPGRKRA